MSGLRSGDLIVIVGSKVDTDGFDTHSHALATVVEVGKYDVFAIRKTSSSYRNSIFKVPKGLCEKIKCPDLTNMFSVSEPKIGDLVLSVTQNFASGKIEKKSGILKEITNLPWEFKTAKILIGSKYESVPYDSLLTLEE
tara:strand:+ start:606 stop:1022 length:417 start_codon:yes stop_codon:yes gene_type:complete